MITTKLSHRITSIILSILMLTSMLVLPQSAAVAVQASAEMVTQAASGEHLTEVPEGYTAVRTVNELKSIRDNPAGNYILINNIDLSGTAENGEWDTGSGWLPIPAFSGVFDGNGCCISNMNIYGSVDQAGLITTNTGTIKNVSFTDVNITSSGTYCGAVCAINKGVVEGCSVSGIINAECTAVGGLVGYNQKTIRRCRSSCNITSNSAENIGGIAGYMYGIPVSKEYTSADIEESFNTGTLSGLGSTAKVGGIVGTTCMSHNKTATGWYQVSMGPSGTTYTYFTVKANITNCYNGGIISSNADGAGIIGHISGGYTTITDRNGLATGEADYTYVTNCLNFNDGRIYGDKDEGITVSEGTNIIDCYCLSNSTFGQGGNPLATNAMKHQENYHIDFDIWEMLGDRPQLLNNPEYPLLQVNFRQTPKQATYYQGDELKPDGVIFLRYSNGYEKDVPITLSMLSGYDMNQIGSQTVTVTYRGFTLTYPIKVIEIPVQSIALDSTELNMHKEDIKLLSPTITPENATNKTITWTSSDGAVATVDETGKVTAVAPGKATITAATSNGKKATCAVTVIIPADSVTLDKNYAPINKSETLTLRATTTPSNSTDKLTWASSDENVATVDSTGKVTAIGAGTANITVTADSGVFASCFVEVSVPAKSLTLSSQTLDMIAGGNEVLTLTVDPSDTTDDIEWSASSDVIGLEVSSDKRTATVYANRAGSAEITVTASSGIETKCTVNVVRNADSISFNEYYKTLEKGDTFTLKPILDPADSSDKVTWHSDNTSAVSVDENGKITAVGKGTANVSAQILNGQTATVAVTVTVSPTSIELDKKSVDIVGTNSTQLFAVVAPDDADKEVTWSSSNNEVAYVDSYGNVYGVSSGTAKITAKTQNGLSADCTVNVKFIDISKATIQLSYTEVQYDGSDKTPNVTVYLDGKTLSKDNDYAVIYSNNNSVGTATVTVNGKGNYEGKASTTFRITEPPKINISTCTATLNQTSFYYDGYEKKPSVTVKNGYTTLYENSDYTVSYSNNRNIGTATVTLTGIGGYTGTKKLTFTIEEKPKTDISGCTVSLSPSSYSYNGTAREPRVTVKDGYTTLYEGTDYTVSYSNNVNVGTATVTIRGIGNYTGTKTATFSINEVARTNISNCTITLSKTSYTYDGAAKRPTVTVRYGNTTLYQGTDYTVAYTNNTRVGTATVTVTGIGNYTGTKTANFTINSAPKTDISGCTINLSQSSYIYDGGAKRPNVTVKRGAATLVNGTDYTVAYSNNTNVGKATVTVTGIGNYTGTKTATFIIKSPTPMKTPFTWGIDNWNFLNSSYSGDFSSGSYRSQINSTYANALKENLTSSEYQAIFVGTWYSNAWLDEKFGGSCYGMSSTTLLAKQGFLPYSSYKSGADELHDLDRPTSNTNVSSLITYYQMLQIKGVIQQQYRTVPKRSHETNINEIISLLDSNDTVLLGFRKDGWGGHAILAYDYEYGNWTKGGVSYGARIKICDPNSSSKNDENYYIYYNTRTYAWAIPAYQGITSAKGATFNYIGANIDEINQGGYLSGSTSNRSEGFIARIDAFNISENRSVAKVQAGENGSYLTMNAAAGDIEEDYSYVLGNESEGTIGYNLRDGEAAYRVTQGEPDELELAMTYENCSMIGGSKAGESVIFDKSGFIEVNGQSAEYAMAITMNDEHPTDWFTVAVKGQGADLATLKQVDNGWVVASDSLNNVEVTVNNKYDMATTTFTTEYPAALIYEIDEDTIGIAVDKDDNGTYETTLDTKTSKSNPDEVKPGDTVPTGNLGDIDGDGEITANDALTILRSSVGMADLTTEQNKLADVDGDTEITANDALAVLRYSVGLAGDDSPINKPIAA